MSYQKRNQFTGQFTFPIPCCDDTVKDINIESNYFIAVNMYSGYWQVVAEEEVRERLALLTPDGKRRWKVMHMVDLNAAPTFVSMMVKLQME